MSLYDDFKKHFERLEEIQGKDLENKANIMQSAVNLLGFTEELLKEKQHSQREETQLMLSPEKTTFTYQQRHEEAKKDLGEYLLTYSCREADLQYMQKMKLYLELLDVFVKSPISEVTEDGLKRHYKKLSTFKEAYQKQTGNDPGTIRTWKQALEIIIRAIERGELSTAYLSR